MPFRMSSTEAREPVRGGVYVITEDIIAVDGGQGETFRRELAARYDASVAVRKLCWTLDLMWGISGCLVGGGLLAILYAVPNENVAYTLGKTPFPYLILGCKNLTVPTGWAVPWAYAAVMAVITVITCKKMLKDEKADEKTEAMGETGI